MSTGVQPPSAQLPVDSPPTARKPSLFQKLKQKQPPPAAFETQAKARRAHQRSSSFSGFVQRILPSHREEKGYALRQKYEDNGSQDPVDLIFGVSDPKDPDVREGLQINDGGKCKIGTSSVFPVLRLTSAFVLGIARKTRSWSPRKGGGSNSLDQSDNWKTISDGLCAGRQEGSQGCKFNNGTVLQAAPSKMTGSWGRVFGLKKVTEKEGEYLHQHSKEQPEVHIPLSSIDMPELENSETTKAQQMYKDKKARRQQRRSLRESGDFLGVQGANPRTGYWDISSGTSSSEPSQMSEETKKKLNEEARDMEEKKRKYEEAQAKHQAELSRVQSLRDNKKKEKERRKKMELKMKQRRHGKWKLSEHGWSSVAEPELSPIVQSVVGSPARETAPADRLFPMPCAADPTPYVNPYNIGERDYFGHRLVSSPLAKERSSVHSESRNIAIPRKRIGSPVRRRTNQSSNTIIHTGSGVDSVGNDQFFGEAPQQISDPTKECPRVEVALNTQRFGESILNLSPSQKLDSFLDSILPLPDPGDPQESEATAISYQSVSMSQAEILQLSGQSPKGTSPEKRYTSLKELPPVNLKDPFTARLPLSSNLIILPSIWAPPTIHDSPERQVSRITTSTITTTGYAHPQPLLVQLDRQNDNTHDTHDTQVRRPSLQRKTSRIPLRTSSHQNSKQHAAQNTGPQTNLADIATSSEHPLAQTKRRTIRSSQTRSPGGEKVVMQSTPTPTSMFTSPQTPRQPGKVSPAARTAALTAFQSLRHRAALKKTVGQDREDSLTPPKLRRPKKEMRDISPRAKVVLGGRGDIGSPSRTNQEAEPDQYERRLIAAVRAGGPGDRRDDSLVVWHPEPNTENKKSKVVANTGEVMELTCIPRKGAASPARKPVVEERSEILSLITTHHNRGLSPIRVGSPQRGIRGASSITGQVVDHIQPKPEDGKLVRYAGGKKGGPSDNKRASPKSATPQLAFLHTISRIAFRILQTAWWFVEPVFDPESDLRKRWEWGNALTWSDMGLFAAAAVFMGAILLIMIMLVRALVLVVQIVRWFGSVLEIVTGF